MAGRVSPRAGTTTYRVGRGGASIHWADGQVTVHSAGSVVTFGARQPRKVEGRLHPRGPGRKLGYEAPALEPS